MANQQSVPDLRGEELQAPWCYLSSAEAGWDALSAQAFYEPMRLDGWLASASPDIALIVFTGGAMSLSQRPASGSWQTQHIRNGDLILRPAAGQPFEVRWQNLSALPTRTLHLRLGSELLVRTAMQLSDRDPARIALRPRVGFQDPLLTQIGFALWRELEEGAPAGKLYAQTAAQLIAVHLLRNYTLSHLGASERAQRLAPAQLRRVLDFIQAQLGQELSLEDMAQQAGFSPYHFARLFRQTTGESPHQFVLRQRVEHAQRLLESRELTLAQVALASGFANQSHLTRAFRRQLGITPRAYRQSRTKTATL